MGGAIEGYAQLLKGFARYCPRAIMDANCVLTAVVKVFVCTEVCVVKETSYRDDKRSMLSEDLDK